MNFKKYIESDVNKWGEKKFLFFLPQFRFVYLKRKCEWWRKRNKIIFLFWRAIYQRYKVKYLMDIPAKCVIGPGLKIEHIGGIVINPNAVLGNDISLLNNVLIGSESRGKRKGCPKIGNRVYIASGVVIVGNITIGNNVLIAANSFVNHDIPDDSIVIGNKIIHSEAATDGYI